MAANPERMRPTQLSETRIMQEANDVVRSKVVTIVNLARKYNEEADIKAAGDFLANNVVDRKYDTKSRLIDPSWYTK